jgi:hypothetical protein
LVLVLVISLPGLLSPVSSVPNPPSATSFEGFEGIDESNPRIVLIGDTQITPQWKFWLENNEQRTRTMIAEIASLRPAAVIHLGDLVTRGDSAKDWALFDELSAPIAAQGIPYIPIHGNHDYSGEGPAARSNFEARFAHSVGEKWHTFRFRNTGFILLDSNFGALGLERTEEEVRWFERTLGEMERDPDVAAIVCCTHHPPFTNSLTVRQSREVELRFARPFQAARKPGVFFSGHCHSYEHFFRGGKHFIVSGGGGGRRFRVQTAPSFRGLEDLYAGSALRFLHFCVLEIGPDKLVIRVVRPADGTASGAFETADEWVLPEAEAPVPEDK